MKTVVHHDPLWTDAIDAIREWGRAVGAGYDEDDPRRSEAWLRVVHALLQLQGHVPALKPSKN